MNVLPTSACRRVELLRCLPEDLDHTTGGIVIAADASEDAPCMYLASRRGLLPRLQPAEFSSVLLGVTAEHDAGFVNTRRADHEDFSRIESRGTGASA